MSEFKVGSWVIVLDGMYKGELAKVEYVDTDGGIDVKLACNGKMRMLDIEDVRLSKDDN